MDTIVYYGAAFSELGLETLPGARRAEDGAVYFAGARRRVVPIDDPVRALAYLRRQPVEAALLDARQGRLAPVERMLEELFPSGHVGGPLLRQRILAVVDPGDAQAAFALGRHGIGGAIAELAPEAIAARLDALLGGARGKIAICLAGGGIEGLLYEVGVLRALESFLVDRAVVDVDLFCGISAGAILGALLANGVGPDEILRSLEGRGHRIDPLERMDLFEPNLGEARARLWTLTKQLARGGVGPRRALSSLARAVPSAAFSGRRLGRWLERQLSRPQMSDSFDGLRRPLYVGATDQDTSEAVLFGDGALRHVPVHRAVHASCALVPFYPPVEIDGRRYIDGAFSRTTNMRVAARKGATLVILVDPLVPARSREAGHVHARGGIYGTTQSLKALINGRFTKAVDAIANLHPNVRFHLFRPEAEEMRILSGSPMKYFYRREVEAIAYEATMTKLRDGFLQLERDFALHGVTLRDPDAPRPVTGSLPRIDASRLGA